MRKLYGWSYFDKLVQLNPQIGRSANDTVTMLNAGERDFVRAIFGEQMLLDRFPHRFVQPPATFPVG